MRVLHTLDYSAEGFGRPQAVRMLQEAQQRSGWETRLVVGEAFGESELRAWRHWRKDELGNKSVARTKNKGWQEWLLREVEEFQPDLIHTHELADSWALAGRVSCPLVLSIRVDYRRLPQRAAMLESAERADWVEYWNPDILGWLRSGGVRKTSWNCAPVFIEQGERQPERGLIVSQGRLDEVKNQRALVAAMPGVLQHFPDARLLLVGDGPDRELLQDMSRSLQVEDSVSFAGWQQNTAPYLLRSHVAAYPGRHMGFDRAIMEALTLGAPLLTSPELSPVTAYGRWGTIVEEEELEAALLRALEREPIPVPGAQEMALREFSPEAVLRRTREVYEKVL